MYGNFGQPDLCSNPINPFVLGYSGYLSSAPEPKRLPFDDLNNLRIRDYEQRDEEEKIIRQINDLLISNIKDARADARVIVQKATQNFPYSQRLKRFLEILEPPRARSKQAFSNLDRSKEFEWIKINGSRYKGQWVALYKDRCLAAGRLFSEVRNKALEQTVPKNILITFISDQEGQ